MVALMFSTPGGTPPGTLLYVAHKQSFYFSQQ
jgi:hypothetical protein